MKPRHLSITAFGPFAGTVDVDFTRLEGRDLLLIEGPTGAGKTSILDAMTYALFGAVPGARHEVESELRSAFAEAHAICEVTFEFALGERVYRARRRPGQERARKRGAGKVVQKPDAHLYEMIDGVEEPVCPPKVFEVDAAVQRLLGLSVEQFKQVLLLPQGEFREFLLARSNDKEALLEKLFGTSLYKDVTERLGAEKRALERRCLDLGKLQTELFRERGVDSQEALEIAAAQAAAEVQAATVVAEKDGAAAQRAWQRHAQAVALATQVAARDRARVARAEADSAHAAAGPERALVADAERAAPVAAALASVAREAERAEKLGAEAARAAATSLKAEEDAAAVEARAAVLPERRAELEQLAAREALLASLAPVEAERDRARAEHAEALRKHKAAAEKLTRIDADDAARRAQQVTLAERLAQAAAAASQQAALAEAATVARRRADLRRELAEAQARLQQARQALSERQALLASQRAAVESARAAMERRREAREANLAAELAQNLRDGSACPVCGSASHPAPAQPAAGAVPPEHVAQAEKAFTTAATRLSELEAATAAATADVGSRSERATEIERALLGDGPLEPLDAAQRAADEAAARRDAASAAAATATQLGRERDAAAVELDRLAAGRREAGDALAQAAAELETIVARGKELAARLAGSLAAGLSVADARAQLIARRDALVAEVRGLEAAQIQAGKALADARARHAQLVDSQAEQARVLAESRSAADAAARAHGFADAAAVAARILAPEELRRRREALAELDRRRTQARDRLVDAEAALAGADMAALADAADVGARAAERAAAEKLSFAASERLGNARAQSAELARAAVTSRARAAEQKALEAELLTLGHLSRVCAGENALKMSLGRYVLAARMEEVAVAASERLFVMSRGRYRLRRTDEVRHAGRGSGLDLVVDDSLTGAERSVHSLSGGEMFLASLALAMGLADVVQAHAGGIRLDSLFIDEGFGSLDDDTLDQVMHTLSELRAGGRLVGLISHVHELRERLSTRLTVVKGAKGSTLRLVV